MRKFLLLVTSLALLILPISAVRAEPAITGHSISSMVNAERSSSGMTPLSYNAWLAQAAQAKADDMARRGYFSHMSPEGRGFQYWVEDVGYKYAYTGENLAIHTDFTGGKAIVESWMKSPGHRENIVSKQYTESGVGIACGIYQGAETVFVVQLFGSPRGGEVSASVEAQSPAVPVVESSVETSNTIMTSPRSVQVAGTSTYPQPSTIIYSLDQGEVKEDSTEMEEESVVLENEPVKMISVTELKVRPLTFGEYLNQLFSGVRQFLANVAFSLAA